MSTPKAILRTNAHKGEVMSSRFKERLLLENEDQFRDTMQRMTDELVERTERMIGEGRVKDYSHIQEIWLGKAWDSYFKQIEEMDKKGETK